MLWSVLAVLLGAAAAAQVLPTVPDAHIAYLGGIARPDGIEGLRPAPPALATASLFSGGFSFGADALLRAALDAAPHARLVAFDSPGGRPSVADTMAELIRKRHLDTYVERFCASACTVAFAGGTMRSAGPRAQFAFHRAALPALADLANIEFIRMERRWFVRSGISLSFGNRALHAPNLEPYLPGLDELVAAGYLHRVRGLTALAQPVGEPLLQAIHQIEPLTAAILVGADRQRAARGMADARSRAIALDNAGLVAARWLSRSSDTAILALTDATLAALAALDPVACMRWQVGLNDQVAGLMAIPIDLRNRLLAAQTAILRDANVYPEPLLQADFADADGAVRDTIATRFGRQALTHAFTPEHAFDDPAESCAVSIAYLRGLRERPEGASLLRWALASG